MDVDDDDAFLYGEQSPPPQSVSAAPEEIAASAVTAVLTDAAPASKVPAMTPSMAASLAAYGINPTEALAAPDNPEDGGVEEDEPDMDDDEDSDDEDDVKLVFSTASRGLDLRKPQTQPSNVIGIGKWAHTSTGKEVALSASPAPTPNKAPTPAPIPGQTTEYTPAARPGVIATPTQPNSLVNAPIPASGDAGTAPNLAVSQNQANGLNGSYLPPSNLPPVTAPSSYPKIDPSNPTGIIPSTGTSVYDIDMAQFEGSGQAWRRPGSDISDWFNFGFDETTFPKFLRYRQEMEAGRQALMNLPMGVMPPQIAELLHLQMNQMNGNMGMGMGGPGGNMPFTPQMIQNMIMQGIDPAMMLQQMQQMGVGGQGMMSQGMIQEQMQQRQVPSAARPSVPAAAVGNASLSGLEPGEEVKVEEGSEMAQSESGVAEAPGSTAARGRGMAPGLRGIAPARGALRSRGAVPLGPRAGVVLPANIPKGPKAGRFRDKDKVDNATSSLDYGADHTPSDGGSRDRSLSHSRSPSRSRRRREKSYESYASDDSSEREYQRRQAAKRRDREKEDEEERARRREKRKRDDGSGGSAVLGPGGWESGEEEDTSRRSSRRRRSTSTDEDKYKSSRRKR